MERDFRIDHEKREVQEKHVRSLREPLVEKGHLLLSWHLPCTYPLRKSCLVAIPATATVVIAVAPTIIMAATTAVVGTVAMAIATAVAATIVATAVACRNSGTQIET